VSEDHIHHPLLCVPVRNAGYGSTLRLFRERDGSRCAVAFTSEDRLREVLGERQDWAPLAEPALRDLTRPLGVTTLVVDPNLVAPPVAPAAPVAATSSAATSSAATSSAALVAATAGAPVSTRGRSWDAGLNGIFRATVAVGAADLLLQLLS
jgi:hypothetical protein